MRALSKLIFAPTESPLSSTEGTDLAVLVGALRIVCAFSANSIQRLTAVLKLVYSGFPKFEAGAAVGAAAELVRVVALAKKLAAGARGQPQPLLDAANAASKSAMSACAHVAASVPASGGLGHMDLQRQCSLHS